jgi:hypothetical protein
MKIEEVINIYDFLGKLSLLAFIGVAFLILVVIFTIILPLREKISLSWKTFIALEMIVLTALVILYLEARQRNKLLPIANAIKTNFINTGYYKKSFRQIGDITYLSADEELLRQLKKLPELYPTDFLLIHLYSQNNASIDTFGIRLIDPDALELINKKISEKALAASQLIASYMKKNQLDTISTSVKGQVRLIDNEGWLIGQDFFKALIGKNGLMPVYDTINSYPEGGYNITGFCLLADRSQ